LCIHFVQQEKEDEYDSVSVFHLVQFL